MGYFAGTVYAQTQNPNIFWVKRLAAYNIKQSPLCLWYISGAGSCNSSINRRLMLNSISKHFRHRRTIMTRANSLKKSIKQILQLADKSGTLHSMISSTSAHFSAKSPCEPPANASLTSRDR